MNFRPEPSREPSSLKLDWPWLAILSAVSALAAIPLRHDLRWIGDEGIWLRAATEILNGRLPYRDFFEFHGPLGFYAVAGWLAVFGSSMEAARGLTAVLATLTALAAYMLCVRVSQSRLTAAFLALVWIFATQGGNAELTHHSVTTLFSLAAMWFTLSKRAFLAGLLSGACGMTTQTRGALCALASLASLSLRPRTLPSFLMGLAAIPIAFLVYLLTQNAADDALRDMILWPLTSYSGIQRLPFGEHSDIRTGWAPAIYLLTLAGAVPLWRTRRGDPAYRVSLSFGVAGLLGSFPRPDAIHLAWTLPMALPLASLVATELGGRLPRRWRITAATPAIVFAGLSMVAFVLNAFVIQLRRTTATPAGEVAFREAEVADMVSQLSLLPPDDPVFFYPYMPMVPFLTRRDQVGRYDVYLPHYTTKAQYQDTAGKVTREAKWVVYDRRDSSLPHMKKTFPNMPDAVPTEYLEMEALLASKFVTIWSNARFEIRRASHADDTTTNSAGPESMR